SAVRRSVCQGARGPDPSTGDGAHAQRIFEAKRQKRCGSILAEIKFLRRFLAERIAYEALPALRAEVETEIVRDWFEAVGIGMTIFALAKKLADRFHVILIEVGFG